MEFGVEDYRESNTRFLLRHDQWSGLVLDGSPRNIEAIRAAPVSWQHDLRAVCAFVDRDNNNELLRRNGVPGDIGLLSIDVDGNDYWIWEAIEQIRPRIVVCEYNLLFGPDRAVTIPYDPGFRRTRAHWSNLYYGASIAALAALGARKGYALVGGTSAGVNAFFVREDVRSGLPIRSPADTWVRGRFRESRDRSGRLTHLGFDEARRLIAALPLVDVASGATLRLADV